MNWIWTSRNIGKAVKNAQRLRQILGVFAKHGFEDVVIRMDLGKFVPKKFLSPKDEESKNTPVRLKEAFEELGPTFVKLGQVLSTRPDLLPESYIEQLTELQDHVAPIPFTEIQRVIESELKAPLSSVYSDFSEKPLASASIGQVHAASLHSGEEVVVKVQRPGIDSIIKNDISLLSFLAKALEKYIPESRILNPTTFVEEFLRTLTLELDFVVEANNMIKMSENLSDMKDIVIPKVYPELSTTKILTQERFRGIKVNELNEHNSAHIDRKFIASIGNRAFFKSIMIDGLFHGDLHGGNLFILPGNRIGIIDFGIVGRLSQRSRDQLVSMVMSLLSEDYEKLCYQYAELGSADPSIDFEGFQRDIRNSLSPYMGLSLSQMNIGKILIESTKIATKYQIKVPGDWMIVFKAILTIESMGRTLDPDFDLLSEGRDLIRDLMKNQYSFNRISKETLWIAKDIISLFQVLPRQIRWMFKKFNSNDFIFEIKVSELSEIRKQLNENQKNMSTTLIGAALLISGSLSLGYSNGYDLLGFPIQSVILTGFGILFLFRSLFR